MIKTRIKITARIVLLFIALLLIGSSCNKDDYPVYVTTIPTLTTLDFTEITPSSATSGGYFIDSGGGEITAKGVCWSTSQNPTKLDFVTNEGIVSRKYTSIISGLTANTTYYVRAYATNKKGTGYGNELSFVTENVFPVEKVSIAGGTFSMGSNSDGATDLAIRSVTLSDFSISKYEITNAQYATFMNDIGANRDGSFSGVEYLDMGGQISHRDGRFIAKSSKENYPVIRVTWFGAKAYAEHYGGRLPTEAEWEFAARGGNMSGGYTYSGSNTIGDVAWYTTNSGGTTHSIGTKWGNELGLHDMSGNVWEWINDWYGVNYSTSPSNNPQGPSSGLLRVFRGGSKSFMAGSCRVERRSGARPHTTRSDLGFRPVFIP